MRTEDQEPGRCDVSISRVVIRLARLHNARFIQTMSHTVPVSLETSHDPITRMRVFQLATALIPDAYQDARLLQAEPITAEIAGQLYAAVSSIEGHIGEGYSRSSGKDRARIFEYALGSVRESMTWYRSGRPALGEATANDRLQRLEEMRRLFLAIIPRERGRKMK
jgi:four helix bundle protein